MIDSSSNLKISRQAKAQAESSAGGGFEQKLNDLQSYGTSAGAGTASFLISHIPVVGPLLAKGFDLASSAGIAALYEKWLKEASTREERISYALFFLEKALAASLRQAYNTVHGYHTKASVEFAVECKDCQDAFRVAYADHLSVKCLVEIEAGCKILEQLVKDLRHEATELKGSADARVTRHNNRYDTFRDNHPQRACLGPQTCYWRPGPPTPFSTVTNEQL